MGYVVAAHHPSRETVYLNTNPWFWAFRTHLGTEFKDRAAAERLVDHIVNRIGTTSRIEIVTV